MAKYRKKPVVIEAMQLKKPYSKVYVWLVANECKWTEILDGRKIDSVMIATLEGNIRASIGDWIIKGVQGEFYPCKPDIFEATYEAEP